MNRWIIGVFLVICLVMLGYFLFRPKDECDYLEHARKAGVDFGVTIEHVTSVKGTLGLTDADLATLDQFRRDYEEKFRNICIDHRNKTITDDQYNCRRENMDRALDQFRLLSTVSTFKDKSQAEQALNAIRQFANSGAGVGCQPSAKLVVNPEQLDFPEDAPSIFTQVTNLGKRDTHYSFNKLPLAFLPTPSSGSIASGQMISVVFVRTRYPMPEKDIDFFLADDFNENIALRIKLNLKKIADVYQKLGQELVNRSGDHPTLEHALGFVTSKWPGLKNEAARYMIAANLLDTVGDQASASQVMTLAMNADKSLEASTTAQFTLAMLKANAGDRVGTEEVLQRATKFVPSTDANAVLYLSGLTNLKFGEWQSASTMLCSQSTKSWATVQSPWLTEAPFVLETPGVAGIVTSDKCRTGVLQLALQRYRVDDPEYGQIVTAIRRAEANH